MAGTISMLAGAAAEVLPSPVGSSPNRSVTQRAESRSASVRSLPKQPVEGIPEKPAQDSRYPAAILERARSAGLGSRTTLMFERDVKDGRMYLYIKDKRTGEEEFCIPKKALETADPQPAPGHRVDVRI